MRYVFICIFLISLTRVSAQSESGNYRWIGFNGGIFPDNYSLSVDLNIPVKKSTFLNLMGDYRTDFRYGNNSRFESMGSSLTVGKWIRKKALLITFLSGISMDLVIHEGSYIRINSNGNTFNNRVYDIEFGLPLRISTLWLTSKWLGLGIHALYKVTLYDSYGSLGISFALGKFP